MKNIYSLKDQIKQICTFLKLLSETLIEETHIGIQNEAREANLPYYRVLSSVLVNKGILQFKRYQPGKNTYKWICTTEPNLHMAKAVLNECRRVAAEWSKNWYDKNSKNLVTNKNVTLNTDNIEICKNLHVIQSLIGKPIFGISVIDAGAKVVYGNLMEVKVGSDILFNIYGQLYPLNKVARSSKELDAILKTISLEPDINNMV